MRKHVTISYMRVIVFPVCQQEGLESNPSSGRVRVWLAAADARSGRQDDANWEAGQVLALNPDFSLQRVRQAFPFKEPADMECFLDGLRIAGIEQ